MDTKKFAFCASGGGTTIRAIGNAIKSNELPGIESTVLIVNRECGAMDKWLELGLQASSIQVIDPKTFQNPQCYGEAIIAACNNFGVDHIGMYGFLPIMPPNVIEAFRYRILNQHPASLDAGYPDFGGRGMHGLAAVAAQYRFAELTNWEFSYIEATAHHAIAGVDEGELIATIRLEIEPGEGPEALQERLLPIEHKLQIRVLQNLAGSRSFPRFRRRDRLIRPERVALVEEARAWGIAYAKDAAELAQLTTLHREGLANNPIEGPPDGGSP